MALAPVERSAVTEPGRATAGGVGDAASGIAEHAHRGAGNRVLRAGFEPLHEVAIERILGNDPPERTRRGHDMIDPSCGLRIHSDVADRRLAQRSNLELKAVHGTPDGGTTPGRPVGLAQTDVLRRTPLVIEPDVAGRRAVDGMTDVIDPPRVGVIPLRWHPHGAFVVAPERPAELAAGLFLEGDPAAVLDQQQFEGIAKQSADAAGILRDAAQ